MAKVAKMTDGLKRRQTYEEVIDYIDNDQDKIRYPDRTAKQLRNTFELSQLDGVGMQLMEEQQMREMKEREKIHYLRQIANASEDSYKYLKAQHDKGEEKPRGGPPAVHDMTATDDDGMFMTPGKTVSSEIQEAPHEALMPSAAVPPMPSPQRPNTPKPSPQRPQVPSPEQPASSASTPTKGRTRVTERKGTKKETNDPETGHPGGAPKETKPRK